MASCVFRVRLNSVLFNFSFLSFDFSLVNMNSLSVLILMKKVEGRSGV